MNENSKTHIPEKELKNPNNSPVKDTGGFVFSSFIKISDPNTQEVIVQKRGDN
jgi:hypothetical protein